MKDVCGLLISLKKHKHAPKVVLDYFFIFIRPILAEKLFYFWIWIILLSLKS